MNIAYVRVSSEDQNYARQEEALKQYKIDKWFKEKVSGKNVTDRPELQKLLEFCREGDTIYVVDFSRLARSTKDLLNIVDFLDNKNVHLISQKEALDTSTNVGRLMLTFLSAIYEFERANIKERQKEGIAIAKKNGVYKGRSKKQYDTEKFELLYNLYITRGKYEGKPVTVASMSRELNLSRPVVYRIMQEKS